MMSVDEIVASSKASIKNEDLRSLLLLLYNREIKNVLEIGTWKGYSAKIWEKAFNPEILVSIELEKGICEEKFLGPQTVRILDGWDSHKKETLDAVGFTQYDFLFIDGDHTLEGVTKDWEMYSPLVKSGGVIVLHDVIYTAFNPDVQVKPLWDKLKKDYPYIEIKSESSSTGMGVIFKD